MNGNEDAGQTTCSCVSLETIQSSVKAFPPGFGICLLKYCPMVECWGEQRNILRAIHETEVECFHPTLYKFSVP